MVSATNGGTFQGNVDFSAGADVTGNITVTGTVDGRDVATDGTKLDGIEALADVTDATNVAAAGAAMLTGATFTGAVTATSFTGDGSSLTGIPTPTLTSLGIANHDQSYCCWLVVTYALRHIVSVSFGTSAWAVVLDWY